MQRAVDIDLNDLRDLLLSMGGCVEKAIDEVYKGLVERSPAYFERVHQQEDTINLLHSKVDKRCLRLLAKQAPVASDLRLVSAVAKINTDLERMGDQAVNISYNATEYLEDGGGEIPEEFHEMQENVRLMVKGCLDAFVKMDVDLCRNVLDHDDVVDDFRNKIVDNMKAQIKADPDSIDTCLNIIMIARNMERLADHATNIAEEVIFVATGKDVRHGRLKKVK